MTDALLSIIRLAALQHKALVNFHIGEGVYAAMEKSRKTGDEAGTVRAFRRWDRWNRTRVRPSLKAVSRLLDRKCQCCDEPLACMPDSDGPGYFICDLCNWEQCDFRELDDELNPNGETLGEAKARWGLAEVMARVFHKENANQS